MKHQGDFIQTYSGRQFWPLSPARDKIFIEDIAHALSMSCRFNGHCLKFYSVAEHSVHIARRVPDEHKLWALLHDASEAYIADVSRPLKKDLVGYAEIENNIMLAVASRYGLSWPMPACVKAADNGILLDERRQNMRDTPWDWKLDCSPLGVALEFWTPEQAKAEFLQMFVELTNAT